MILSHLPASRVSSYHGIARLVVAQLIFLTLGASVALGQAARGIPGVQPKVIGGSDTPDDAYPWMVALVYTSENSVEAGHFCGGTLIHPYWVVTAAHCVEDLTADDLDVALGVNQLSDETEVQVIPVAEIVIHPNFRTEVLDADIALLRLEEPADARFTPLPVIEDEALDDPGATGRVLGWGDTGGFGVFPDQLQEADIPVVDLSVANPTFNNGLTGNMLPAGFFGGTPDTCQGDSGGPLVVADGDGDWVLAGITSFGFGCGQAANYGVYTRVANFVTFINEHLFPNYGAFERRNGVAGVRSDADRDGIRNFGEYAFGGVPNGPSTRALGNFTVYTDVDMQKDFQALTIRRPADADDVVYSLEFSSDFETWTASNYATAVVSETPVDGDPSMVDVTLATPVEAGAAGNHFLRAVAKPAPTLNNGTRSLRVSGFVNGNITDADPINPDVNDRRMKEYLILEADGSPLVPGEEICLTMRSAQVDARLELIDANTRERLDNKSNDNAGGVNGTDETLTFVPEDGVSYLARASTRTKNDRGHFELSAYRTADYDALPRLSLDDPIGGQMTTAAAFDPIWLPNQYFSLDFVLDVNPRDFNDGSLLRLLHSSFYNPVIEIVDYETGRLERISPFASTQALLVPELDSDAPKVIRIRAEAENTTGSFSLQAERIQSVAVGGGVADEISTSDRESYIRGSGYFSDDYAITGYTPGDTLLVYVAGFFDSYLYIIDAETNQVVAFDDDSGGSGQPAIFLTTEPDVRYVAHVTSWASGIGGIYEFVIALSAQ